MIASARPGARSRRAGRSLARRSLAAAPRLAADSPPGLAARRANRAGTGTPSRRHGRRRAAAPAGKARNARCSTARSASARVRQAPAAPARRRWPGRPRRGPRRRRRLPEQTAAAQRGSSSSTPARRLSPADPPPRPERGTGRTGHLVDASVGDEPCLANRQRRARRRASDRAASGARRTSLWRPRGCPQQLLQGRAARRPRLRGQAHHRDPGPDPGRRDRGQADAQARLAGGYRQGQVRASLRLLRQRAHRGRQGRSAGAAASCATTSTTSSCSSAA